MTNGGRLLSFPSCRSGPSRPRLRSATSVFSVVDPLPSVFICVHLWFQPLFCCLPLLLSVSSVESVVSLSSLLFLASLRLCVRTACVWGTVTRRLSRPYRALCGGGRRDPGRCPGLCYFAPSGLQIKHPSIQHRVSSTEHRLPHPSFRPLRRAFFCGLVAGRTRSW